MEHQTRIGDVDVAWEEHGEGSRTLALVHGFTGARLDFEDHVTALGERVRVIAADHRGHGGSTNFGEVDAYSLEILAADLIGFLELAGGGPVDLLGHSMGGMVALRVALARPDLLRSLILMDTAAESLGGGGSRPDFEGIVRTEGLLAMHRLLPPLPEAIQMQEQRGVAWMEKNQEDRLLNMDPEAFIALAPQVFDSPSLVSRLDEITCPTTVIVGARDRPFRTASEHLAAGIDGAELRIVDGAWHSPQRTHPEEWRDLVLAHLDATA